MEVRGFAAHLESWENDTELFIGKFSLTSPDRPKKTPNFEKYHWKKKIRKILVWTDGWWHNRCSLRHSLDGLLCIRLAWTSQNATQDQQNSSHRPDRDVSLRHCWSSFVFETNCLSNVWCWSALLSGTVHRQAPSQFVQTESVHLSNCIVSDRDDDRLRDLDGSGGDDSNLTFEEECHRHFTHTIIFAIFAIGIFRTCSWTSDIFPVCMTNGRELCVTRLFSLSWHCTWSEVVLGRRVPFLLFRRHWWTRLFARILQINDTSFWTDWINKLWIASCPLWKNIIFSTNKIRPVDSGWEMFRRFHWRRPDTIRIVSLILDSRDHPSPSIAVPDLHSSHIDHDETFEIHLCLILLVVIGISLRNGRGLLCRWRENCASGSFWWRRPDFPLIYHFSLWSTVTGFSSPNFGILMRLVKLRWLIRLSIQNCFSKIHQMDDPSRLILCCRLGKKRNSSLKRGEDQRKTAFYSDEDIFLKSRFMWRHWRRCSQLLRHRTDDAR